MGNSQSSQKEQAMYCSYSKIQFKDLIAVIQDSHAVMQFYASSLLLPKIPIKLVDYKGYNSYTEDVFNARRHQKIDELTRIDPGLNNLYDVYSYVRNFKETYESQSDELDRKLELGRAFEITYGVMQYLIKELAYSCEAQ